MRPKDHELVGRLTTKLRRHALHTRPLVGIRERRRCTSFVRQLVDSIRRVRYVYVLRSRELSPCRLDPASVAFDPLRGAILAIRAGAIEEAFWLVFLFVHFGKHRRWGWRYARAIYGRLGAGRDPWDWTHVSSDPQGFRSWLDSHQRELHALPGGFGSHRKYESLDARSPHGTGAVVASYVRWVAPPRTHEQLLRAALQETRGNATEAFDLMYQSMADVKRFGRTARFDYLCMVSKLDLAPIHPGSPYMRNATGPVAGARLLFAGTTAAEVSVADLDSWLVQLDHDLGVGMQALEDALCNWQKSPSTYKPFRG